MTLLQHLVDNGTVSIMNDSIVWWPQGDLFTAGSIGIILTEEQVQALADTEKGGEA